MSLVLTCTLQVLGDDSSDEENEGDDDESYSSNGSEHSRDETVGAGPSERHNQIDKRNAEGKNDVTVNPPCNLFGSITDSCAQG
jgi:hypothetical protein